MSYLSDQIDQRLASATAPDVFMQVDDWAVTYGQVCADVLGLLGVFADQKISAGSRVGVFAPHPADVAALVLTGFRGGVAVVVLNVEFTPDEIARAWRDCGLDLVFVDEALLDQSPLPDVVRSLPFRAAGTKAKGAGLLGRLRGKSQPPATPSLHERAASAAMIDPPGDIPEDTVALLLNTSGTTSAPKVVELTHRNIAAQLAAFETVYDFDAQSRILNPLPLHFTDGLFHGPINTFLTGATLYRPVVFDMGQFEELLNTIYRDSITHLIVVPAILALMDRLGNEFTDSFQTDAFRYVRSSGDRLPEVLWRSIEDRFGVTVVNTYGMSETVCEAFYSGPDPTTHKVGTIGKAVGCDWRIVGEDGAEVAAGERGELQLTGDIITRGYAGQPEMTAQSFVDVWFRTGDLATADADDFVTIVGRSKDLIIAGGVNVHPQEIVDCLLAHDGIADAAAFGLPHGVWGEQIAAAVVLKEGGPDRNAILSHCRAQLAPHKIPRVIKLRETLPRNPAGKVLVADLIADAKAVDTSTGSGAEGTVAERVLAVAAETFGVAPGDLHPSSQPDDVPGWDSFAHLTLISALEAAFDMQFSAREVLRVDRLSDLTNIIVEKSA